MERLGELLIPLILCYYHQIIHLQSLKLPSVIIINIFILIMDQITTCNEKGVSHCDEPTENYHQTLQSPSALQSFMASFSSLFQFSGTTRLYCLGGLSQLSLVLFFRHIREIKKKNSYKPSVHYLPSIKWHTGKVNN